MNEITLRVNQKMLEKRLKQETKEFRAPPAFIAKTGNYVKFKLRPTNKKNYNFENKKK